MATKPEPTTTDPAGDDETAEMRVRLPKSLHAELVAAARERVVGPPVIVEAAIRDFLARLLPVAETVLTRDYVPCVSVGGSMLSVAHDDNVAAIYTVGDALIAAGVTLPAEPHGGDLAPDGPDGF